MCQMSFTLFLDVVLFPNFSHLEALVPSQGAPPPLEVHVDVGGDQVVHLVALMAGKKTRR